MFIDESDAPVAVVEEDGRLAGGIVQGLAHSRVDHQHRAL